MLMTGYPARLNTLDGMPMMHMAFPNTALDMHSMLSSHSSPSKCDSQASLPLNAFSRSPQPSTNPSNPLKRSRTQYDDLPEIASNGKVHNAIETSPPADLSLDRDNKLLHFATPAFNHALLDYTYRRVAVSLSAQLHGMFFLADSLWTGSGDLLQAPRELTCYRRNLFSISGHVHLPRGLRYILSDHGEQIPIVAQELELSATESVEHNSVKIISVPWKTPVGTGPVPEEKTEREPTSIALDLSAGAELDRDMATIAVSWKRLQFRIATANNGRRKELQQYFTVKLRLMATLSTGQRVSLCETASCPVIVRGRSPRNFQAKREVPVGIGSLSSRKGPIAVRSPSTDTTAPTPTIKHEPTSSFDPTTLLSPEYFDFKLPNEYPGGAQTSGVPAAPPIPNVDHYTQNSPHASQYQSIPAPTHLPPSAQRARRDSPDMPTLLTGTTKRARVASFPPASTNILWSDPPMSQYSTSSNQIHEPFPLMSSDWSNPFDFAMRSAPAPNIN